MKIKSRTPKLGMICIRCHKEIKREDNYLQIFEFNNKQIVKENFVHKSCWELLMDSKKKIGEAMGMLKGVRGMLQREGIFPEEEMVIE